MIKNLIIGSGPAGIATAMALKEAGEPFELLDVAYDLEADIEQKLDKLSESAPEDWDPAIKSELFPPPETSTSGVERRLYFGSDAPYRVPDNLVASSSDCSVELSHSLGGFGNVWGAAVMPYSQRQLGDWPIDQQELFRSYRNVSRYMPQSAEIDDLSRDFPLFAEEHGPRSVKRSSSYQYFLGQTSRIRKKLAAKGITVGRARLAVDSSSVEGCRYCGQCLGGCPYGSIFNPRLLWKALQAGGARVHKGLYVLELEEKDDLVVVTAADSRAGSLVKLEAKNVFLGAGHFASTKILARSLGQYDVPISIKDSQYFFFPFFSYRAHSAGMRFTLAESFVELDNPLVCDEHMHMQVYGKNQLFAHTLDKILPSFLPKSLILDRLLLFQGYLPSRESGKLVLTLRQKGSFEQDFVEIKGVANQRSQIVANRAKKLLRKSLLGFGLVPPGNLVIAPPGRSFHTGGSFPMGGTDPVFRSDLSGRPASFKRVYLVDAASFPDIASSTIAFTIMANADRIVRSVYCWS